MHHSGRPSCRRQDRPASLPSPIRLMGGRVWGHRVGRERVGMYGFSQLATSTPGRAALSSHALDAYRQPIARLRDRPHLPTRFVVVNSRVPVFVYEAKRKSGMFCMSCRSAMNFVKESLVAGPMRNSGSVWRSAFATTNSEGGMPGRMVRSQDPKELQTSLGAATPRQHQNGPRRPRLG
jgi:hypothetical protein